ncbi:caspase family protein [Sphingobacterium tabacisoli]|uniref:Caspase family protein n=1 Tax=Sphingobacterium tabacisoli TaxID=2044855 RepID=A0ABW5L000_9SPHI|nr:caspase family protein [Sphingobacterium tabacisoli]
MMTKKILSTFVLLLMTIVTSFAQSFTHYSWQEAGINYNALMVYRNADDILVRVNYTQSGVLKLAEYKAVMLKNPSFAPNDLVYKGGNAKVVYSKDNNVNTLYIADYLYLKDYNAQTNKGSSYYVIAPSKIGDQKARNSAPQVKLTRYKDLSELQASGFKLTNYFLSSDPEYKRIAGTSSNAVVPSKGKSKVHVILVGDTNDEKLGKGINNEIGYLTTLFGTTIGKNSNATVSVTALTGQNCTRSAIISTINQLNIGSEDAVFFHYNGHGSNTTARESEFPRMALKDQRYGLEDLYTFIRSFNPRLAIVTGDLCNSVPRARQNVDSNNPVTRAVPSQIDPKKVNLLFTQARGGLISTSSSYGEFSWALNGQGAFTGSFRQNLEGALYDNSNIPASWTGILEKTYKEAFENTKNLENRTGTKGQRGFYKGTVTYI